MALLKPCPFCGEDCAGLAHDPFDTWNHFVECSWCGAKGPIITRDSEGRAVAVDNAIDGWNERV
jgi:Lar family restriction alleviation protein